MCLKFPEAHETFGSLVQMQVPVQWVWGGSRGSALLTSSQVARCHWPAGQAVSCKTVEKSRSTSVSRTGYCSGYPLLRGKSPRPSSLKENQVFVIIVVVDVVTITSRSSAVQFLLRISHAVVVRR